MRGAALFVQVFNENVGCIVPGRQVSDVVSTRRDIENTVREPVYMTLGPLDLGQTDTIGIGRNTYEVIPGLINLLCRHGDNKG